MKPVQHDHAVSVDVKLSEEVKTTIDDVRGDINNLSASFADTRKAYVVGGIGGIVLGVLGARLFIRPVINITVTPEVK
jgi:hypothetical protein